MSYPTELFCDAASQSLKELLEEFPIHDYMEIGCYKGVNAVGVMYAIQPGGTMWLLDYYDMVERTGALIQETVKKVPLQNDLTVRGVGNSRKDHDSYCWSLGNLLLAPGTPELDCVFLDGAHTWHHDGFAALLAAEMLRPGGFLVLDDCYWSMQASGSMRPEVRPETEEEYTSEQIRVPQVQMVALLMQRKPDFELFRVCDDNDNKRIYRKRA